MKEKAKAAADACALFKHGLLFHMELEGHVAA